MPHFKTSNMNKIKRIVSFFLKIQGSKEFNITEKENKLYIDCTDKPEALIELYNFFKFDYNPFHNNELCISNKHSLLIVE